MKDELNIAILTDETKLVSRWAYEMLTGIIKNKSAKITSQIQYNATKNKVTSWSSIHQSKFKHRLFYVLQKRNMNRITGPENAFEPVLITNLVQPVVFQVDAINEENSDAIIIDGLDSLISVNCDLIINLTQREIKGKILDLCALGIWSFTFGATDFDGRIPLFWKMFEGEGYTGVSLTMKTLQDNRVLYSSTSLLDGKSPILNLNKVYWKIYTAIPRKIKELRRLGKDDFLRKVDAENQLPYYFSNYKSELPSNLKLIRMIVNKTYKRGINKLKSLFYLRQWILLYHLKQVESAEDNLNNFIKIIPPKDRIWADPHIIERDNKFYIFIEELIYSEDKGYIAVIVMDQEGNYTSPVKVLETDYHLSYPFLIEDKGELYMIPETKQTNNIQLFKCIQFPDQWEFVKVLIDGVQAADTTILFKDNKYWLFTNHVKNKLASKHDELYLYYADELITDKWTSHPENPVVTDVRNARPAGSFFTFKNKIFRPSQNCAYFYGYGVQINELVVLNERQFLEETVNSIDPKWENNILAIHSFARLKTLTFIDARLKRRRKFF